MKSCPKCEKYMKWKYIRTANSVVEKYVCDCGYEVLESETIWSSGTRDRILVEISGGDKRIK